MVMLVPLVRSVLMTLMALPILPPLVTPASALGSTLPPAPPGAPMSEAPRERSRRSRLTWIGAGVLLIVGTRLLVLPLIDRVTGRHTGPGAPAGRARRDGDPAAGPRRDSDAPPAAATRFTVPLGDGETLNFGSRRSIAISPDGSRIVYSVNDRFELRSLDAFDSTPIPGIEGVNRMPAFSPDGRTIAYHDRNDNTIKLLNVQTQATRPLARPAVESRSDVGDISWCDDAIFVATREKILRIRVADGKEDVLVTGPDETQLAHAQLLPDGDSLLFTIVPRGALTDEGSQVVVESLRTHKRTELLKNAMFVHYAASIGQLIMITGGVVSSVPFDARRLAINRTPTVLIEGVRRGSQSAGGVADPQLAFADNGTVVYAPGSAAVDLNRRSIAVAARDGGQVERLSIPDGPHDEPRVSPDGRRVAYQSGVPNASAIWIAEVAGGPPRRLTFEGQGQNRSPVWSPDSQFVAFASDREGRAGLFRQRADGNSAAERLTTAEDGSTHRPEAWSPDGQHLLYVAIKSDGTSALWMLTPSSRKAEPFGDVQSAVQWPGAVFSPDGRWVAYSARVQRPLSAVYVQPFPPTGARFQVSRDGEDGHHPLWTPSGRELIYTPGPGTVLNVVPVTPGAVPQFGAPRQLQIPFRNTEGTTERPFDLMPDGRRFVAVFASALDAQGRVANVNRLHVILNWFAEFTPARH